MPIFILLAFIIVPVVEIAVFIQLGGEIGLWNTIFLIFLTAIIGSWVLRRQGLATLQRAQESLARQVFPVAEVFDGLCLVVAGILLLTPGFVTDAIGFLLLLPFTRLVLRTWIWKTLARSENARAWVNAEHPTAPSSGQNDTIDGEFRDITPEKSSNDTKLPPHRDNQS